MYDNLKNEKKVLNLQTELNEVKMPDYQLSLPLWEYKTTQIKNITKKYSTPARTVVKPHKKDKKVLKTMLLPLPQQFPEQDVLLFERRLQAHVSKPITVIITDNRSSMISVKTTNGTYKIRLHHMFLKANSSILKALGRYIENADIENAKILEDYIELNSFLIREKEETLTSKPKLQSKGKYFDLKEIFQYLNLKYFNNSIKAEITWGKELTSYPKHHTSVKMGTYSVEDKLIKIHRALDRNFIPRYFLEFIVFHEMLHQVYGVTVINGRKIYHPVEFLASEKKFANYYLARNWEKRNLTRLLYF